MEKKHIKPYVRSLTTSIFDVPVTIEYEYEEGVDSDYETPPVSPSVIVCAVYVEDTNISNLLDVLNFNYEEIKDHIVDRHSDEAFDAMCEEWDALYDSFIDESKLKL